MTKIEELAIGDQAFSVARGASSLREFIQHGDNVVISQITEVVVCCNAKESLLDTLKNASPLESNVDFSYAYVIAIHKHSKFNWTITCARVYATGKLLVSTFDAQFDG